MFGDNSGDKTIKNFMSKLIECKCVQTTKTYREMKSYLDNVGFSVMDYLLSCRSTI